MAKSDIWKFFPGERKRILDHKLYSDLIGKYSFMRGKRHIMVFPAGMSSTSSSENKFSECDMKKYLIVGEEEEDFFFDIKFAGLFGKTIEALFYVFILEASDNTHDYNLENLKFDDNVVEKLLWYGSTQTYIEFMDRETDGFDMSGAEGSKIIDIGAGNSRRPNCITLDIGGDGDHLYDMNRDVAPFGNNSVDRVYACHALEHTTPDGLFHCMEDMYRVLKPGGKFHILVPHYATALGGGNPHHMIPWSDFTIKEICGKDRIYTSIPYNFAFKMVNKLVWGKRRDQIHLHFILEKVDEQEIRKYTDKGDSCLDSLFDRLSLTEFLDKMIGFADFIVDRGVVKYNHF